MPISAGNQNVLINSKTHTLRRSLNRVPLEVVAIASVTETPARYPLGAVSVSWTSGLVDVQVGMMVAIRVAVDGDYVAWGVVRKSPTSDTLYIDGRSRGDAGFAIRNPYAITDGHYVEVYNHYPLWSLVSRIKKGRFFKKFDIPYDGSGSEPPPVVNIGAWRVVETDPDAGVAEISFDNDYSFGWFGRELTGCSWYLPPEAVVTVGTLSTFDITITLPPGFWQIKCVVTDEDGNQTTAIRPVWVNDSVLYPAYSDSHVVEIVSDNQTIDGRTMQVRVWGQHNDVLPGTAFIYKEEAFFDDQQIDDGTMVDTFVGYVSSETPTFEWLEGQMTMVYELKSPMGRFEEIAMVSQVIRERGVANDWTKIARNYGTSDFVMWYLLHHHTTYLTQFDYHPLLSDVPRKKNWAFTGANVAEYIKTLAAETAATVGCDSSGALYYRFDPLLKEVDYRDAIDQRLIITPDIITEAPEWARRYMPQNAQIRIYGAAYVGNKITAVASLAPGTLIGQSAGGAQDQDSLVLYATSVDQVQDDLNRIAGHMWVKLNNPEPEITLSIYRNIDIFEPAKRLWFGLELPAIYTPRNQTISTRLLVTTVDRSWEKLDNGDYIKRITVTFETESEGQPGQTYIVGKGATGIYPPQIPAGGGGGDNAASGASEVVTGSFRVILAWDDRGNLARTSNGVSWTNVGDDFGTHECRDFAVNWDSPYVRSGWVSGTLGGFAVTIKDNILRVWQSPDILTRVVEWEVIETPIVTGTLYTARILTLREDDQFVVCAWYTSTGVYVSRSEDGGVTWETPFAIGSTSTSLPNLDTLLGADLNVNGSLYIGGLSNTSPAEFNIFILQKESSSATVFDADYPTSDVPPSLVRYGKGAGYVWGNTINVSAAGSEYTDIGMVDESTWQLFFDYYDFSPSEGWEAISGTTADFPYHAATIGATAFDTLTYCTGMLNVMGGTKEAWSGDSLSHPRESNAALTAYAPIGVKREFPDGYLLSLFKVSFGLRDQIALDLCFYYSGGGGLCTNHYAAIYARLQGSATWITLKTVVNETPTLSDSITEIEWTTGDNGGEPIWIEALAFVFQTRNPDPPAVIIEPGLPPYNACEGLDPVSYEGWLHMDQYGGYIITPEYSADTSTLERMEDVSLYPSTDYPTADPADYLHYLDTLTSTDIDGKYKLQVGAILYLTATAIVNEVTAYAAFSYTGGSFQSEYIIRLYNNDGDLLHEHISTPAAVADGTLEDYVYTLGVPVAGVTHIEVRVGFASKVVIPTTVYAQVGLARVIARSTDQTRLDVDYYLIDTNDDNDIDNINGDGVYAPNNPQGMDYDSTEPGENMMVGRRNDGNNRAVFYMESGGIFDTLQQTRVPYVGVCHDGSFSIFFGRSALAVSTDRGETLLDITGNWESEISPVSTVIGVFSPLVVK